MWITRDKPRKLGSKGTTSPVVLWDRKPKCERENYAEYYHPEAEWIRWKDLPSMIKEELKCPDLEPGEIRKVKSINWGFGE